MPAPADLEEVISGARDYYRGGRGDAVLLARDFAKAIVHLSDACVVGCVCDKHGGAVHGAEAEELRAGIEQILRNTTGALKDDAAFVLAKMRKALFFLLDHVDARDSLGFIEASEQLDLAVQLKKEAVASICSPKTASPMIEGHEDRITSTRSNASADARRDFEGFDVDEELVRLRRALRDGRWRIAAELSANLDEHLARGGSLPVAWLGPVCMQSPGDLAWRLGATMDAAVKLSAQDREVASSGYVAVVPAPDQPPGSSWGIHCHEGGCVETLTLERTTPASPAHEDDWRNLGPALDTAAVALGWRTWQSVWWCPSHTVAKLLACARCLSPCPECSCVGGPRGQAVDGMIIDVTEPKP